MEHTKMGPDDFAARGDLSDWRVDGEAIDSTFRAPDYLAAADLIRTIAEIAEENAHHPDLELTYPGNVHVTLTTHDAGGLTTLDAAVAELISAAATRAGIASGHG